MLASSGHSTTNPRLQIMAIPSAHTQIAKILEMEKETHWLDNKDLSPDEIQRLWAAKSAPLTAVLGAGAPTHPVDLNTTQPAVPQATPNTPLPIAVQNQRRRSSVGYRQH